MSRAKGEGQVTKLANGKWRARVVREGKTANATRSTKREAVAEIPALRARLFGDTTEMTVADWLHRWVEAGTFAPETYRLYRRAVDAHLVPAIGHLPLSEVTTPIVQRMYATMAKDGLGTAMINRNHNVLSVALGHAVREGHLTYNPTREAQAPKHTAKKPHPLSPDEARRLLAACRAPGAPSGRTISTILLLGLRVEEALALRWHHVDRANMRIAIPGTKTKASEATLPMPAMVADIIGEQGDLPDDAPVFASRLSPLTPTSRQTVHRHLKDYLQALGIQHRRIHDLRHSTGALLASVGVPTRLIQSVLRHSSAAMSVHYSQSYDPDLRKALDSLSTALDEG